MADQGLTIYNDSNTVQIDSTYRNISLIRTTAFSAGANQSYATTPLARAVYSTGSVIVVPSFPPGHTGVAIGYFEAVGSGTFYEFDHVPYVAGTFGFEVRNVAGEICFTSNDKPLRVLAAYTGTISSSADAVVLTATFAGKKCAVVFGQLPITQVASDSTHVATKSFQAAFTDGGATVTISHTTFYTEATASTYVGWTGDRQYDFLIIDITNY